MYTDDNNCDNDNDNDGDEKYFFDTINFNNKQWASKPSTSLKRKILKLEIREIRVIAPLFYDFFGLLFNLRFESQSDVVPTGSL